MGRVKHPDTFTCDICGRDLDKQESEHVWPVMTFCNETANEYGVRLSASIDYNCEELFLCRDCMKSVAIVRRRPVFYGESTYELAEGGQ